MAIPNRRVNFTCSTEATLTISIHAGKKDYEIKAVTKLPQDGKIKQNTGCKSYYERGNEAQEKEALAKFESLLEQAKKAGWTMEAKAEKAGAAPRGFDSIPAAPATEPAKTGPTPMPRHVAKR